MGCLDVNAVENNKEAAPEDNMADETVSRSYVRTSDALLIATHFADSAHSLRTESAFVLSSKMVARVADQSILLVVMNDELESNQVMDGVNMRSILMSIFAVDSRPEGMGR
jgi:hypothetical protein